MHDARSSLSEIDGATIRGGWRERVAVTLSSPYVVGVTGVRTRTLTSVSVTGDRHRTNMRFYWCPDMDIN